MASILRADIQGLRAVAVLLVALFHIWPQAVPAGYVGVDVFFVISGYLITALLYRDLIGESGRISLGAFYARRIRRLLPVATLVLLVVVIAGFIWLPLPRWKANAIELAAAAFYVENWVLAHRSIDYLAQDLEPSAVQHYWSLSVEEQFYVLWPLLMAGVAATARRFGMSVKGCLLWAALGICWASFGYAVYLTSVDPAPAYFSTATRAWELGIGAVLALAGSSPLARLGLSRQLSLLGLAAILVSAFAYDKATIFPGTAALLPVLGTALVIAANNQDTGVVGWTFASRPMQFIGSVSYALYLWHWPLIVFFPLATGLRVSHPVNGILILSLAIVLAAISKRYVEDRFRFAPHASARAVLGAPALALACMGLALFGAAIPYMKASKLERRAEFAVFDAGSEQLATHPGAEAIVTGRQPAAAAVIPQPAFARTDRGPAYKAGPSGTSCIGGVTGDEVRVCSYGPPASTFKVVILGDSHSVHWYPALERLATESGWRVLGASKSSCAFSTTMVQFGSPPREYEECMRWTANVARWALAQKPDLIIVSVSPNHSLAGRSARESQSELADGFIGAWTPLIRAGMKVAVVRHTPWQGTSAPDCMITFNMDVSGCSGTRAAVLRTAGLDIAAAKDPRVGVLDFTAILCPRDVCPVVIGNVLVYRDKHHLTATFSRTMAGAFRAQVKKIVPGAP